MERKIITPDSNDCALIAFTTMSDKIDKLEKNVKRLKFKNTLYLGVSLAAIYFVYDNLNQRTKVKRNEETN